MSEGLGRYFGGKVLTAILVVAVVITVIWYYRLPDADRQAMWSSVRSALIWIGFAAVLPWATFYVPIRVARIDSNRASALMLAGYLVVDAAAGWIVCGLPQTGWQRMLAVVALLAAGIYNYVIGESVARKAADRF